MTAPFCVTKNVWPRPLYSPAPAPAPAPAPGGNNERSLSWLIMHNLLINRFITASYLTGGLLWILNYFANLNNF